MGVGGRWGVAVTEKGVDLPAPILCFYLESEFELVVWWKGSLQRLILCL